MRTHGRIPTCSETFSRIDGSTSLPLEYSGVALSYPAGASRANSRRLYVKVLRSIALIAALSGGCAYAPVSGPVTTPNGVVFVDDGGRGGLPVVFIHGNGADLTQWSAQLEHLRKTRRAVAIDRPDMANSAPAANRDYPPTHHPAAADA